MSQLTLQNQSQRKRCKNVETLICSTFVLSAIVFDLQWLWMEAENKYILQIHSHPGSIHAHHDRILCYKFLKTYFVFSKRNKDIVYDWNRFVEELGCIRFFHTAHKYSLVFKSCFNVHSVVLWIRQCQFLVYIHCCCNDVNISTMPKIFSYSK